MEVAEQLELLSQYPAVFSQTLRRCSLPAGALTALSLTTMQINLGNRCNQACRHCHMGASREGDRIMDTTTAGFCIDVIAHTPEIETVDLTGGAPEMNGNFIDLVTKSRASGKQVIDRCNLTILEEPGFEYLYEFLSTQQVAIVASLPHFAPHVTNRQRGQKVFEQSIKALKKLNQYGYGTALPLNLVYNPGGIFLSAPQEQLQREYKTVLERNYGIVFNNLYCINNITLNRFLKALVSKGKFQSYTKKMVDAFNPATLEGLMCRHQISIGYDGYLYDCDFNQVIDLTASPRTHISEFDHASLKNRTIQTANHCYGCTAGSGSSCGGEII